MCVCKPDSKVWISLFTCCGTCAIHLDLVLDITADSFIRCFKRFMARRGTPHKIISDNSKTFKSANKELDQIHAAVREFFARVGVEWSFNAEKAPMVGWMF